MALTAQNGNQNGSRNGNGNRRRWLIAGAVIVAVILLAAFMSLGRKQTPIRAERATTANIVSTISTNGKVEPVHNFEAHAPAPATVKRLFAHEGDRVKAGQLLLELDDAEARAQAAKAQAQLQAAEADLHAVRTGGTHEEVLTTESQLAKAQTEYDGAQRSLQALQRLQQKGAASAGEVEAAENRLKAAQADLELAQKKQKSRYSQPEVQRVQAQAAEARAALAAAQDLLQHSDIRAPFDGTVYALPVRQGQFVNAGDLLVQAADLNLVQVRAFVDEPDIGRLRPDEQVQISWDAIPGRVWDGTLTRVPSSVVTLGSRNVGEITCRVDNSDHALLPNVNVSVNIVTARADNVVTVPREAVHQQNGQLFVFTVSDDKLHRQNITTGISNLTRIEVTQGLAANSEVALGATNGAPVRNGMSVRVVSP